jgi:hypothetical protein
MTPDQLFKELTKNTSALQAVSVNLARQGGALNETLYYTTGRIEKALSNASGRLADALDGAAAAADKQALQLARWTKVLGWATGAYGRLDRIGRKAAFIVAAFQRDCPPPGNFQVTQKLPIRACW